MTDRHDEVSVARWSGSDKWFEWGSPRSPRVSLPGNNNASLGRITVQEKKPSGGRGVTGNGLGSRRLSPTSASWVREGRVLVYRSP